MNRAALVASVLVVLAGCSGFAGETETLTPAPVPEGSETPEGELAPGVTAERVTDPLALSTAHERQLRNRSFTFQREVLIRTGDGEQLTRRVVHRRVSRDGTRVFERVDRTSGGSVIHVERWHNESEQLIRTTGEGTPQYIVRDRQELSSRLSGVYRKEPPTDDLFVLLLFLDVRVENAGEGPPYRLVAREVDHPERFAAEARGGDPRNVTFRGTLTGNGLVREHELRYTTTSGGREVVVQRRVRYSDIGNTTVDRPEWGGAARNATAGQQSETPTGTRTGAE